MRALPRSAFCLLLALGAGAGRGLPAADCWGEDHGPRPDCDRDGVPDVCAISGKFAFTAVTFSLGLADPVLLAAGDLDGDGDADLVSMSEASTEIALLLNAGDGLDLEVRRMDLSHVPAWLAAADLDGDGLADLALTAPSSLQVLRSAGDAAFLPAGEVPLTAEPMAVFAADLDGDGDLDLAVLGNARPGFRDVVSLVTNEGPGRFSSPRNFGVCTGARWLAARDLDGDGDVDLAIACDGEGSLVDVDDRDGTLDGVGGPGGISVLWNRGGGSFLPPETFDPGMFPVWIDAGDVDGDGDGDLVATGAAPDLSTSLVVSFRNAGGAFEPGVHLLAEATRALAVLDDLDADGDPDLALAKAASQGPDFLVNDGGGRFSPGGGDLLATGPPAFLLAADLDADGDRDLAVAGGPMAVSLFLNDGGLAFGRRRELAAGGNPESATAIDLDQDGDLDLAVRSTASTDVMFLWNEGAPDFRRATFHVLAGWAAEIEIVDLDADGLLDLAAALDPIRVQWGEGPGRFGAALELPAQRNLHSLALGDLDGDGRLDLAGAVHFGPILLYSNLGGRAFAPPRSVVPGGPPHTVISGDLDGDGDLDLAADLNSSSPGVQAFLNDGAGAFEALSPVAFHRLTLPVSIGSADLDLDGDLDLMAPTVSPDEVVPDHVSLLWNRGDATFDLTSTNPLPWAPLSVTAADLDGDADPEMVTTGFFLLDNRTGFEGVGWWPLQRMDSAGTTAAADLDQDGLLDLVSFTGSRSALVLLNRSSPPRRAGRGP